MTSTYLSIDPALKNLAICFITFDNNKSIINVEPNLVSIMKKKTETYENIMKNLIEVLDKLNINSIDDVIIENQPSMKNPKVKSVAVALFTYFLIKKKNVHFVSPSLKLTKEENKLKYAQRKKLSISKSKSLLHDNINKKIDEYIKINKVPSADIADCICMAHAYHNLHK